MNKSKKRLITLLVIVVWLVGCYVVGRILNPPETAEVVVVEVVGPVSFENSRTVSTEEIPWGFTAGEMETEEGTKAWLLTPGTGVRVTEAENFGRELEIGIHPWMQNVSDGTVLRITATDKDGAVILEEEISLGLKGLTRTVPENAAAWEILNLNSDREEGDWVLIRGWTKAAAE